MSTLNYYQRHNNYYSCNEIKQNNYYCNNSNQMNKNCNCIILTNLSTINKGNSNCNCNSINNCNYLKLNLHNCQHKRCVYYQYKRCHYEQISKEAFAAAAGNRNTFSSCCKLVKISMILLLFLITLHFVANLLLN